MTTNDGVRLHPCNGVDSGEDLANAEWRQPRVERIDAFQLVVDLPQAFCMPND